MTAHDNSGDRDPFRKDAGGEGPGREGPGREVSGREVSGREGSGHGGPGREEPGREGSGRGGPGREEPGREGSGREGSGHNGPGREVSGREGPGREGPRRGGSGREDPRTTPSRPPCSTSRRPRGREDAAYLAARDAALVDLAVLRVQLTLIGDALSGRVEAAPAAGERPEETGAARPAPRTDHARHAAPATVPVPAAEGGPRRARRRCRRRAGPRPGLARVAERRRDGRLRVPGRRRRGRQGGHGRPRLRHPRYLACARLVAEGRVTGLEEVPGTGGVQRVTLRASRYYKGTGR